MMYYLYNKPLVNISKTDPTLIIESQVILNNFNKDEVAANKMYVNKIIQLTGQIDQLTFENGNSVIILTDKTKRSSIICHMEAKDNMKVLKLEKGKVVTIKGMCTGFLMDVIMVRCVLISN